MRAARDSRGFSLLELMVVVIAVAILAGLALDRVLPLVGRAQRAAFLSVQRELQSSLLLAAAERITRGETAALPELAADNPMGLLLQPPANYLGEVKTSNEAEIPRASWYFDEQTARLSYRVGRYTRFEARNGPKDRIELRVAFVYEDRDADGVFDATGDRFDGLRLEPVHAYDWPD
jgi:prepilin-type N-terminal cleavage/methylation domain-containing protein